MQQQRADGTSLEDCPMPPRCHAQPPATPNVYTDGSLKHARGHWFSLGGAGVWWPDRDRQLSPLTEAEAKYAECKEEDGGILLYGLIGGHRCSSTRAELAAAIVGISGPGPIHLASDSQAFIKKAKRILSGESMTKKRDWPLQINGDLWSVFERICHAKGCAAIQVSKVKGHATEEM
eukprot:9188485-Karenia_brevis.AAC.1